MELTCFGLIISLKAADLIDFCPPFLRAEVWVLPLQVMPLLSP